MLSKRPSTPYPPSPILGQESIDLTETESPFAENVNDNPKPTKSRLPTRMPSTAGPRAGALPFRSISERCGLDRPTFDLSSGPVPAVFRNKKIDMNWLKKVDLDDAFGPSRRSLSVTFGSQAPPSPDRASRLMSGSSLQKFEPSHSHMSLSTNGRSTLSMSTNGRSTMSLLTNERSTLSFSTNGM